MTETPSTSAMVDMITSGRAPTRVRMAAARGALPLPRATLVHLYVHLLEDADEGVQASAGESLAALSREGIAEALAEPSCPPAVQIHFAKRAAREETLAEKIAFHPQAPIEALSTLVTSGSAPVIELVLTNQERLLEHPRLLERLIGNPALRTDQQARILELLNRATKRAAAEQAREAQRPRDEEPTDADDGVEAAARLLDVDVGELLSASEILGAEELEQSEDLAVRTAYQMIITLNTAQKAILAMKGGREERMILVRDTNRVVAMGVLKNPRLNELEVEAIANLRNVTDEVLRHVGSNREWSKNYKVARALVYNPRTPQGVSANFIPRLNNRDLKALGSSRDVPELIRRMARRTFDLRTQKQSPSFRKK